MVPRKFREMKHGLFQFLPGHIGLRNRACLHHLRKPSLEPVFAEALANLKAGDLCIDCGANTGSITRRLAETGADVLSFEPDPWSFQELVRSVEGMTNVRVLNKAVGSRSGVLPFYRDQDFLARPDLHSLGSSMFPRTGQAQQTIEVEVVHFADFIRHLDRDVAILKMDVEGAEVEILEELFSKGLIRRFRDVFVETHELQFPALLERTWHLRAKASAHGLRVWLDWH